MLELALEDDDEALEVHGALPGVVLTDAAEPRPPKYPNSGPLRAPVSSKVPNVMAPRPAVLG